MMDFKDWVSFFVGIFIIALGLIPLLEKYTAINLGVSSFLDQGWFVGAIPYIIAIAGFYLLIESIREITNSSAVGGFSFLIGAVVMAIGILAVLGKQGILTGPLGLHFLTGTAGFIIYNIIFIIEGFFLMIATFAMEI